MEIFQTIWTVLTTENKSLTDIIVSPLAFIEIYLYMLIFTAVLNINKTKKQASLFVILYSVISIVSLLFIPSPYYTFINLLAMPILIFLIFKTGILKAILSQVIIYIVSFLICTTLIMTYTSISGLSSYLVTAIPIHRIFYSLLNYVLLLLFYILFKNFSFKKLSIFEKFKSKKHLSILLNFIIGSLAIAIQCYIEFMYLDYIPTYLILLSISIFFVYFFISMFSLFRTSKLEITTQDLEAEKLYNQTLTLLYDNIRGFKHDFNNIVQGIGGYIATDNMEGLKEYYSEVLDDCQRVNNLALLSPEVINNPAIYSLLTSKYHEATELGIKVTLEIFMDLSTINMKIYELTRILGILIDNAIEAAKQCDEDEKEIIITFRKDNKKNKQLFIIENTYSNKNVNIDEIFEKGKTSKKTDDSKNHGLGLWEVRQTVKKNKYLDLYTTKSDKYFKQQFEIYC